MSQLAPSFLTQERIARSIGSVLQRVDSTTRVEPPAIDEPAKSVTLILSFVAAELGSDFWRLIQLPLPPDAPTKPFPLPEAGGMVCTWLTAEQLRLATEARWFALCHRVSDVEFALRAYARQASTAQVAPTIRECVQEYLAEKRSPRLGALLKLRTFGELADFVRVFGDQRPIELTRTSIQQFESNDRRIAQRAARVSSFFNWAIRRGYAVTNPVPSELRKNARRMPGNFAIFTPRQARFILRQARDTDQIGFWILSFFAGMRTGEIERLQRRHHPWRYVRFRAGEIMVPGKHEGSVLRIVKISPVLREWLQCFRSCERPFFPPNFWQHRFPDMWKAAFKRFPDRRSAFTNYRTPAIPGRVCGIARTTHIAYRLALGTTSVERIAYEVGDTAREVEWYLVPNLSRRRALDFFALSPSAI